MTPPVMAPQLPMICVQGIRGDLQLHGSKEGLTTRTVELCSLMPLYGTIGPVSIPCCRHKLADALGRLDLYEERHDHEPKGGRQSQCEARRRTKTGYRSCDPWDKKLKADMVMTA